MASSAGRRTQRGSKRALAAAAADPDSTMEDTHSEAKKAPKKQPANKAASKSTAKASHCRKRPVLDADEDALDADADDDDANDAGERDTVDESPSAAKSKAKGTGKAASSTQKPKTAGKGANKQDARQGDARSDPEHDDQPHGNDNKPATSSSAAPAKTGFPIKARKRLGPNGELMIPHVFPLEAESAIDQYLWPGAWASLDDTPGRVHTTRNPVWRVENLDWVKAHAKQLKYNDADWTKKAEDSANAPDAAELVPVLRGINTTDFEMGYKPEDWVCACRPEWEVAAEKEQKPAAGRGGSDGDDEDMDMAEEEWEDQSSTCAGGERWEGHLASQHPEHTWIRTVLGADRYRFWVQEQFKRDQDSFGMHINNDFSGYGFLQVVQNALLAFDKSFIRPDPPLLSVWAEIEGLAFWLNDDLTPLMMVDDSEAVRAHVACIGLAVLHTIHLLMQNDEFGPRSSVRNLSLVLALFVRLGDQVEARQFEEHEGDWIKKLLDLADQSGVEINGVAGIKALVEDVRLDDEMEDEPEDEDMEGGEEEEEEEDWEKLFGGVTGSKAKWKKFFSVFKKKHGYPAPHKTRAFVFGGDRYDITKFTKAERKKYILT